MVRLVSRIQDHFTAKAWVSLPQAAVSALAALTIAELTNLAQQVEAARDRMDAMAAIQDALRLGTGPTPDQNGDGDAADSAILNLRPDP